jgi:hypothetical protein
LFYFQGVHSVICKNSSSKLCELSLNILDTLINIGIIPTEETDYKLAAIRTNLQYPQSLRNYLNDFESKHSENYGLAMDLVLRNIKWLGCIHCVYNAKTFVNDQLRGKLKFLLNTLQKKNSKRFKL